MIFQSAFAGGTGFNGLLSEKNWDIEMKASIDREQLVTGPTENTSDRVDRYALTSHVLLNQLRFLKAENQGSVQY